MLLRWNSGPATQLTVGYSDAVAVGQAQLIDALSNLDYDPGRSAVHQPAHEARLPDDADRSRPRQRAQPDEALRPHDGAHAGTDPACADRFRLQARARRYGRRRSRRDLRQCRPVRLGPHRLRPATVEPLHRGLAAGRLPGIEPKDDGDAEARDRVTGDSQDVSAGIDVSYALSDIVSIVFGYRYTQRFADQPDDEYTENLFFTGVTRRF